MRIAKADDWTPQPLASTNVVPLRKRKRATALLVEAALLGGLALLGIAATHVAGHAVSGRPLAADECCAAAKAE